MRMLPDCFPHARGDGPREGGLKWFDTVFSPRTWGWSVGYAPYMLNGCVFPTHVGMVRCLSPGAG